MPSPIHRYRPKIRGRPIVFGDSFPREGGRARFTPASIIAPAETPDAEYPMIMTTGRQLGTLAYRFHDTTCHGA
jgi:predicted molibdopterin-dependent oxidoreductase YjgC